MTTSEERRSRAYYDAFSTSYESHRDGRSRYHDLLDDLEIELASGYVRGKEVLEVGCGTGLLLRRLAAEASRAVGVDLSPGMLAHARQRGLEVVEATATALPFGDASFDVVCSFKTLPHVPDLPRALAEMARVTRPGGALIVELYNPWSLRRATKLFVREGGERDVHTRFDDGRALRAALDAAGLRNCAIERARGIRVLVPFAQALEVPAFGSLLERVERGLADTTIAARLGGFVVWVVRKTC